MNKKAIPHPSHVIGAKLTEAIRSFTAAAERTGSLHPEQLGIIYEQNWFKLFVSKNYNGLQMSLPEALKIEESLAWVDGSVGWTVTLCSGANWFIGFLNPELVNCIFKTDTVCLGGSGSTSGSARIIEGGYEITGYWRYATGSAHATAFTANCVIENNGTIMQNKEGSPVIKSFLFLREEVVVHYDWNGMGMQATSSNSFEVQQLRVHENRCFQIDRNFTFDDHPVYRFPFLQFAEATLAVNSSGMAIHFMDLCEPLFNERAKNKNYNKEAINVSIGCLHTSRKDLEEKRNSFYRAIENSWNECVHENSIAAEILSEVSKLSRELAATSRKLVDELYPYCGLIAANKHSEINRVWRDLHTASQHSLLI